MKILVINGSPKGDKSNTWKLTTAFLEGLGTHEVKTLMIAGMNINPCKGCFCCWNKTPGTCSIKDDMKDVIELELWADLIIWSFPLYFFSVPGILKNLIDRQLPMTLPFMSDKEGTGSGSHDSRYDMSGKRHVLISTCGFYSAERNYDSVIKMFDHFLGKEKYEKIFCGQGELFRVPELRSRTDEYLDIVKQAGIEYASGGFSSQTRNALEKLLYPREVFEKMADNSWGVTKDTGEKIDKSLTFTRQMAALYNKSSYDGKNRVLEICYTDLGKTYQIELTKEGTNVRTGNDMVPTTRIETPWDVWIQIAQGKIRGDAALADGLYRVTGDFSLIIHWNDFFGDNKSSRQTTEIRENKKRLSPSMITMLVAWIVFWVAVSINPGIGGGIALVCCALIPVVMYKRMTIYDILSCCFVSLLSILAIYMQSSVIPVVIGYTVFGLMWAVSCLTREPLCAAYVKYNYNGDDALQNPIFMKTNRILALAWGILYIVIAVNSWFLLNIGQSILTQIINLTATGLMGGFTVWFEHWYPAHVARR